MMGSQGKRRKMNGATTATREREADGNAAATTIDAQTLGHAHTRGGHLDAQTT